jgi:hypothetical protein
LTAIELIRTLRARRYGKGKWMAKCPAHREKTASLSITQMAYGIRLHCFAGCSQKSVLDALGLTWRDLKPESLIDYEVVAQIRAADAKQKAMREQRTNLVWLARMRVDYWHRKSSVLGRSLMKWPDHAKLAKDFAYALDMERRCRHIWETL